MLAPQFSAALCVHFFCLFFLSDTNFRHTTRNKKNIKKEKKKMLKSNNTKSSTGYDRIEFYVDFVHVLLSAFLLGYVIGKDKAEKKGEK